jgi:hypothetical protein
MSKLVMWFLTGLMLVMGMIARAHGDVVMDDDSGTVKFRVKGTTALISPIEAQRLAPDHQIEQGKPIKNAMSADGKAVQVYQWHEVDYNCKAKTGNCSWKRK